MRHDVVYIVEAKPLLVTLLEEANADLLECVRGPLAWMATEDGYSPSDERLARFKLLCFRWLDRSYPSLMRSLPHGFTASLDTFDEFWTARRIETEGDLADLRCAEMV